MNSSQTRNFTDRTSVAPSVAARRRAFPVGRIALVAALASFGLVAIAMQGIAPSVPSTAEASGTAAGFVTDGRNDPEVQLALLANEDYFRDQYLNQARPIEDKVANAAKVQAVPTTTEGYLPAQFTIDAGAGVGNVMTYERD